MTALFIHRITPGATILSTKGYQASDTKKNEDLSTHVLADGAPNIRPCFGLENYYNCTELSDIWRLLCTKALHCLYTLKET